MEHIIFDGRYELLRPLGQGGMAKVYLARDEVLGRNVALKVLREQYAEDEGFVERFEREARSAAALSHPNVVQIHDRGCSDEGRYYIVMEYVPGGTLKERVRAEGPLGFEEATGLATQIAGALRAAHGRGVIHRDVKPQNVLLAEGGEAKVADFGIALAASAASISRTDLILGTPNYMSPEQAQGEPIGPASDLYSLGVVLYEMLTGRVPFEAETPMAVCMKHINEPAPSPREANPAISEALEAITLRLLSKDPKGRHASAEDLIEDLRRVATGVPPVVGAAMAAPTLSLPARVVRSRWGRKAPLALASLTVLLGMGGGWYLWQGSEGPGIAGFLKGVVPEEARQALDDAGRAVGLIGVAEATGVPRVVGLSAEEAEERLAEAGFESERRPRGARKRTSARSSSSPSPAGRKRRRAPSSYSRSARARRRRTRNRRSPTMRGSTTGRPPSTGSRPSPRRSPSRSSRRPHQHPSPWSSNRPPPRKSRHSTKSRRLRRPSPSWRRSRPPLRKSRTTKSRHSTMSQRLRRPNPLRHSLRTRNPPTTRSRWPRLPSPRPSSSTKRSPDTAKNRPKKRRP
ncbi:MAG: protein kinase [Actinomycetota bacterium]|nr:protein kinase [Actinomycetota bacterium]